MNHSRSIAEFNDCRVTKRARFPKSPFKLWTRLFSEAHVSTLCRWWLVKADDPASHLQDIVADGIYSLVLYVGKRPSSCRPG